MSSSAPDALERFQHERPYVILVLQGGGARGAYQVGVWRALSEAGLDPDWVCGISSGALNAAVIAGNPKGQREEALAGLWGAITSPFDAPPGLPTGAQKMMRAALAQSVNIAHRNFHFLRPGMPSLYPPGTPGATSQYHQGPLVRTLKRFVDWEAYNRTDRGARTRLSLGVADACTGELEFFDSDDREMRAEHVLASGALPPGAAAVEIDGRLWWDGGIVANSPVAHIIDEMLAGATERRPTLMVVVDLFSSEGEPPQSLQDVIWRHTQIQYMSKFHAALDGFQDKLKLAAARLFIESKGYDTPFSHDETEALAVKRVVLLHLTHLGREDLDPFGPIDFSRTSIRRRMEAGLKETRRALRFCGWEERLARPINASVHSFRGGDPVGEVRELELPVEVYLRDQYDVLRRMGSPLAALFGDELKRREEAAHVAPSYLPERFDAESRPVGAGGFESVYRAVDRESGTEVALRVPRKVRGALRTPEDQAREVEAEVQALARIRHPGALQVLRREAGIGGEQLLVLESAGEAALRAWEEEPPAWPELRRVIDELLATLARAHARGVVHRDVSPDNVRLVAGEDGRLHPRLGDFGLSAVLQVQRAQRGEFEAEDLGVGTLQYMAPEALRAGRSAIHPAADLYSLGVILYRVVCGRSPYEADDELLNLLESKLFRGTRPIEPRVGLEVPAGLRDVIARLLEKDPALRYQTAAEVRRALAALPEDPREGDGRPSFARRARSWPDFVGSVSRAEAERRAEVDDAPAVPLDPRLAAMQEPRLVGRELERDMLWALARRAAGVRDYRQDRFGLVLYGAPGSGRTRLVRWLGETLEGSGFGRMLHVRMYGGSSPEPGVKRGVRRFLGLGGLEGELLRKRLEEWLAATGGADRGLAERFASWLGQEGDADGSGEQRIVLVEELVRRENARLDQQGVGGLPIVWVQELRPTRGTRAYVRGLALALRGSLLGGLVLHEPPSGEGEEEDARAVDVLDVLRLSPLSPVEARELAEDLLPGHGGGLLDGGPVSPARVVEAVRLAASGTEGAPAAATLDELATERLAGFVGEGVTSFARSRMLGLASLLPARRTRAVLLEAWERAGGQARLGEALLTEASEAGILREEEGERMAFAGSALSRAARALAAERRDLARLQRAAADALLEHGRAALPAERLEPVRLLLDCGDAEDALEQAVKVAEAAADRDAEVAFGAWELAGRAAEQAGRDSYDPVRLRATLGMAAAARATRDPAAAAAALQGLDAARCPPDLRGPVLLERAVFGRGPAEVIDGAREALAAYGQAETLEALDGRARAKALLARAMALTGHFDEALQELVEALDLARSARQETGQASEAELAARRYYAMILLRAGRRREAEQGFREVLELARRARKRAVEGTILRELGNLAMERGRLAGRGGPRSPALGVAAAPTAGELYAEAGRLFEQALEIFGAGGYRLEQGTTWISVGELERMRGNRGAAREAYEQAVALLRALEARDDLAAVEFNLALLSLEQGHARHAERHVRNIDEIGLPEEHRHRGHIEAARFAAAVALALHPQHEATDEAWDRAEATLKGLESLGRGFGPDMVVLVEGAAEAIAARDPTPELPDGRPADELSWTAWTVALRWAEALRLEDDAARLRARVG